MKTEHNYAYEDCLHNKDNPNKFKIFQFEFHISVDRFCCCFFQVSIVLLDLLILSCVMLDFTVTKLVQMHQRGPAKLVITVLGAPLTLLSTPAPSDTTAQLEHHFQSPALQDPLKVRYFLIQLKGFHQLNQMCFDSFLGSVLQLFKISQ